MGALNIREFDQYSLWAIVIKACQMISNNQIRLCILSNKICPVKIVMSLSFSSPDSTGQPSLTIT
jgi:hypothetical protein